MNRRKFLYLAGLTAICSAASEFEAAVPAAQLNNSEPKYIFEANKITVEYTQADYNFRAVSEDLGTMNPKPVVINGRVFKRGELVFTGSSATSTPDGLFETSYSFHYQPNGNEVRTINGVETFQMYPYAKTNNEDLKQIERKRHESINRR